jgi:DNA-binding beta-propeller fold protein YncE
MEPSGITLNKLGEIYVSDSELNAVVKLSANLEILSFEGGIGNDPGDFNRPSGIGCDAAMNLYVADSGNRRIQILDRNLRPANDIREYFEKDGSSGSFDTPEDVAIDLEGNIWVADDDRVLKINSFNEIELELSYDSIERLDIGKAVSVAVSPSGNIAIGDSGNRKIFIVTSYGNLLSEINVVSVSSVAWEGNNIVWVSSTTKGTISAFDISGNRLFVFSDPQTISRPASLAVAAEGKLIITDIGRRIIARFEVIRNKAIESEK